jgi:hypothetical protein
MASYLDASLSLSRLLYSLVFFLLCIHSPPPPVPHSQIEFDGKQACRSSVSIRRGRDSSPFSVHNTTLFVEKGLSRPGKISSCDTL